MSETLLLVGAASGIAKALAHVLAERGCRLILAARNLEELERISADLKVRHGADVAIERFDALDFDGHEAFVDRAMTHARDRLDGVIVCHGYLPDQKRAEKDFAEARRTIDVNFLSVASVLERFAARFEEQGRGVLAAISSVAGDRGRQSNYLYGASKAGLSVYLQGLRNRLYRRGVHVLTIKPGFVDTPMTHGRIDPRSPLVVSPERVAKAIDRALRRRRNEIYAPWFWRVILLVIRQIPESLFKRLKL
jgi:short-subunit dehydrogenase